MRKYKVPTKPQYLTLTSSWQSHAQVSQYMYMYMYMHVHVHGSLKRDIYVPILKTYRELQCLLRHTSMCKRQSNMY